MTDRPKLHLIPGTPAPETPKQRVKDRVKNSAPSYVASCHRCGGIEVIETKIGVTIKNGKALGGTKQILCSLCYMNGERVVMG